MRTVPRDLACRLDPAEQRHPDVEHRHVGLVLQGEADGIPPGARLRHDLPVGALLEHLSETLSHERVIVRKQKSQFDHEISSS
jgi:hypothetical protein